MRVTWQGLTVFLATGFGVGYCPKIPGTVGTLLGAVLYFGLSAASLVSLRAGTGDHAGSRGLGCASRRWRLSEILIPKKSCGMK